MSTLDDIKQMFFLECDELLEALNDGLSDIGASLPSGDLEPEVINSVFRTVHSIKGGAASFGLDSLVNFSHAFETVLDLMRSNKLQATSENVRILQRCADHLSDLVAAGRAGTFLDLTWSDTLIKSLNNLGCMPSENSKILSITDGKTGIQSDKIDDEITFAPLPIPLTLDDANVSSRIIGFDISLSSSAELFSIGHDPVHLFRELTSFGDLKVQALTEQVPALRKMQAVKPYISWRLELLTDAEEFEVKEVFEFVDSLVELEVKPIHRSDAFFSDSKELFDGIKESDDTHQHGPVKQIDSEDIAETAPLKEAFSISPQSTSANSKPSKNTVRVDLDLVDSLINIVGELVINHSVLAQSFGDAKIPNRSDISSSLDEYKGLALQVQESVMSLRAQSVKQLFQRMARIVRETSELAGKRVDFSTEGEETEIDKTVIERLIEPLTHILRNSIDHGLETPERRREAKKLDVGNVRLSAFHRSGRVLIEVVDDGGGIDRGRVREIALKRGLIAADEKLSDTEIDRLIFLPGFSTKSSVTDLSGRGVGMDVVRSAIQKLGGRVSIQSEPGKGTRLSISLPLTLAVLDGMVVDVAGQTMVIPITAVVETIRPDPSSLHRIGSKLQVVKVRDCLVPLVDLGLAFGYREGANAIDNLVLLLIETDHGDRWALAVDRIIDQRQVVIKSLEGNYGHVEGVAAATILGDGKIALIIDPEEIAHMMEHEKWANASVSAEFGEQKCL